MARKKVSASEVDVVSCCVVRGGFGFVSGEEPEGCCAKVERSVIATAKSNRVKSRNKSDAPTAGVARNREKYVRNERGIGQERLAPRGKMGRWCGWMRTITVGVVYEQKAGYSKQVFNAGSGCDSFSYNVLRG